MLRDAGAADSLGRIDTGVPCMDVTGERRIPAPRDKVWASLNDAQVLRTCLPECQSLEARPDGFHARSQARLGTLSAPFTWTVRQDQVVDATSCRLSIDGQGAAGTLTGTATLRLADQGPFTLVSYTADMRAAGQAAQPEEAALAGATQRALDGFLTRFGDEVAGVREYGADGLVSGGLERLAELRPGPRAPALLNALAMVPSEPLGLPMVFWIGSVLFLVVVLLVFGAI